jgi:hypothetical protein
LARRYHDYDTDPDEDGVSGRRSSPLPSHFPHCPPRLRLREGIFGYAADATSEAPEGFAFHRRGIRRWPLAGL